MNRQAMAINDVLQLAGIPLKDADAAMKDLATEALARHVSRYNAADWMRVVLRGPM